MSSGLSEVGIFNMALDLLSEETLLTVDDDTAVGRWLKRNYAVQRDALLESHPWNFAVKRDALAADSATPSFEFSYQYTVPTDCLRMLPVTTDGLRDSPGVIFVVESGKILINKAGPLRVRYIRRVTNPADMTLTFANLLSHILGARMGYWLTGKASIAKALSDGLGQMRAQAQLLDSLEGTPEPPDDGDVINAR